LTKKRLSRKQRNRLLEVLREAIDKRDRKLFERAIRDDLGLQPDTPEYARCLMKWNEVFRSEK
jgi:hypothetical protein